MNGQLPQLDVFKTKLGWFGVLFDGAEIQRLKFGMDSHAEVVDAFRQSDCQFRLNRSKDQPWRGRLTRYANSEVVAFDDFQIDSSWMTPFQNEVLQQCRGLSYGAVASYKELALLSGSPNAARAVGTTMKVNRLPIIIPCHRVISSSGIGGYSASDGVNTKRDLIKMEQVSAGLDVPEKLLF